MTGFTLRTEARGKETLPPTVALITTCSSSTSISSPQTVAVAVLASIGDAASGVEREQARQPQ
ncbi:hypothetical protein AB4212_33590, partial [Streptomyces sp. 2MCAF27]